MPVTSTWIVTLHGLDQILALGIGLPSVQTILVVSATGRPTAVWVGASAWVLRCLGHCLTKQHIYISWQLQHSTLYLQWFLFPGVLLPYPFIGLASPSVLLPILVVISLPNSWRRDSVGYFWLFSAVEGCIARHECLFCQCPSNCGKFPSLQEPLQ